MFSSLNLEDQSDEYRVVVNTMYFVPRALGSTNTNSPEGNRVSDEDNVSQHVSCTSLLRNDEFIMYSVFHI